MDNLQTKQDLIAKRVAQCQETKIDDDAASQKPEQEIKLKKHKIQCGGSSFEIYTHYQILKNIGMGAFGVVCSGKDLINNIDIAVKKVLFLVFHQIPSVFRDIKDAKRILREIKLLNFFDHPHIVKLLDIVLPDDPESFKDLYLVFHLMHADLQRIITSNQVLCDKRIRWCMYQIISGIYYMHSADIIHRDLKPNNIFINSNCHIKIGDLNLARKQEPESTADQTNYVVQRWYRAPEVLLSDSEYTQAIDIWSLGCILAELLGRTILFQGKHHQEQIEKIVAVLGKPKPEDLPYELEPKIKEYLEQLPEREAVKWSEIFPFANPLALDLLQNMLIKGQVYNPQKRFTIQQCIEHEYFQQHYQEHAPKKCQAVFDWSFDSLEPKEKKLRQVLYEEAKQFYKKYSAQ